MKIDEHYIIASMGPGAPIVVIRDSIVDTLEKSKLISLDDHITHKDGHGHIQKCFITGDKTCVFRINQHAVHRNDGIFAYVCCLYAIGGITFDRAYTESFLSMENLIRQIPEIKKSLSNDYDLKIDF